MPAIVFSVVVILEGGAMVYLSDARFLILTILVVYVQ